MATPPSKRQRLSNELAARGVDTEPMCCSICTEIFEDPHIVKTTGQTYCRSCIVEALRHRRRCPLSGTSITLRGWESVDSALQANHLVRNMLESYEVPCAFAPACAARVKLGELDAHEKNCPHATIPCKESGRGCPFVATRAEHAAHELACPFVLLAPTLRSLEAKIQGLEHQNERLQGRLAALENAPDATAAVTPHRERPVTEHYDLKFDEAGEAINLSEDGTRASLLRGWMSDKASSTTSFNSGKHSWKFRLLQTDRFVGFGVLSVATEKHLGFCLASLANTGLGIEIEDGTVIRLVLDCDAGTLSIGPETGELTQTRTEEWLKTEGVRPSVRLTCGNTVEFVRGP